MGDAGASHCLDALFCGLACTAVDAGDELAVLQGFGFGQGALARAAHDVQRLVEDPDVPCLKGCCTKRCMHDAFNMHEEVMKETFTTMRDLKAAIEAKDTTEAAAPLVKGPSKPRIAAGSIMLDDASETSEVSLDAHNFMLRCSSLHACVATAASRCRMGRLRKRTRQPANRPSSSVL